MKFIRKWGLALVPGLALATPALALGPPDQADLSQPGSVIIFPKFINLPAVTVDGVLMPRTEIEVGVVCPVGAPRVEHQSVKVPFPSVCPGVENVNPNICSVWNFDLALSIDGKLAFPADGALPGSPSALANQPRLPAPPCVRGYVIGWVINTADQPIKFDGLIGNAVIRNPNITDAVGTRRTGLSAYSALQIQAADAEAATGTLIGTIPNNPLTGQGQLFFDGVG